MIESSEPVITMENSAWEPPPAAAVDCHNASPTVSGNLSGRVEHDQRQEVVVPRRYEREEQHGDRTRQQSRNATVKKIRSSPTPSTRAASMSALSTASAA